eukprot:TRINITY_DN3299_c0_g1_i1.p2 TRINITY_DN3299_c0_g1~~TRINITY_DN3299_c0_g1_i1.p2  ORF type:complete len:475 (+),score=88.09 TRINITY_DN3299_c0_g1_i1:40-1425(+)
MDGKIQSQRISVTGWLLAGACVRLALVFLSHSLSISLSQRIELSSPVTSYPRVQEALLLAKDGFNPYQGDVFHDSPLVFFFFLLSDKLSHFYSLLPFSPLISLDAFIMILLDLLTGFVLFKAVSSLEIQENKVQASPKKQEQRKTEKSQDNASDPGEGELCKERFSFSFTPYVLLFFVMNPFGILCSVGQSSVTLSNLFIALSLFFAVNGREYISLLALAVSSYLSIYPLLLTLPVILILKKYHSKSSKHLFAYFLVCLIMMGGVVIYLMQQLLGSSLEEIAVKVVHEFLVFTLMAKDFTPNIGLFWYFQMEIFPEYTHFFMFFLHLNIFAFVIPLAIRCREDPVFLFWFELSTIAIFKTYPTVGDLLLPISLLPIFYSWLQFSKLGFVAQSTFIYTALMSPIFWYMWIYLGSANSNFFYANTIVCAATEIFFLADCLSSKLRWEYAYKHNIPLSILRSLI